MDWLNRFLGDGTPEFTEPEDAADSRPVLARLDEQERRNIHEQHRLANDAEKVARMLSSQYQQSLARLLERYDLPVGCVFNEEEGVIYGSSVPVADDG